jgi:hypothetical protein
MRKIPSIASERGAVLIQTALASLVLVGFGTFVVDYGVLWVGRHQAQNAADAGATAGAIARAYDDFDDNPPPAADGVAAKSASQVAGKNLVWGASSPTTAAVTSFVCPPGVGAPSRCVRVDVYRNGDNGSSPLPTWFAPVLGIASQGVKATASAQVLIPKATNCLRPWAIPDRWLEGSVPANGNFSKYGADGKPLANPDVYDPPTSIGPGTGLTFAASNVDLGDLGSFVPLTPYTAVADPIVPGWLVPLDPTPGGYGASLGACNGQQIAVGDQIPISGVLPTGVDFEILVARDSHASWNAASRTIDKSCAPLCAKVSPRLTAIAVFDVDLFQFRQIQNDWTLCTGRPGCKPCPAGPCVSVVNIVGFFIADGSPSGYLTSYPGVIPTDAPVLTARSSFLKATTLVR